MRKLEVQVACFDKPDIVINPTNGLGEYATETTVVGEVRQIIIEKDGKPQFGFCIQEDGTLVFTDYANMGFRTTVSNNLYI